MTTAVVVSVQNGVTAADIAEASGHKDVHKELMAHSPAQHDVRPTKDDVSCYLDELQILTNHSVC